MKPADPREAMQIALFNARRLVRDLGMLAPDALGVAGLVTHYYERDAAIATVSRVVVALEEAVKKEPTE